jgi:hypothetical protein
VAQQFLSSLNLNNLASDPSSALAGDIYYNTVSNVVKFYNGSVWAAVASGASSGTVTSIIAGTGLTGGTITNSGTIAIDTSVVPRLGVANTFTANQTVSATLTANILVKNGGTNAQFLKADGSVDASDYLTIEDIALQLASFTAADTITPLDNLKLEFDGIENRFVPKYQGVQIPIGNPHRVEISVNGVPQPLDFPEYVWGTPFMQEGFTIDSDGYIAFSEVPPAGATFSGKIVAGSPTSTLDNRYPFRAADILLGAY